MKENIGEILKGIIDCRRISQNKLAAALGLSPTSLTPLMKNGADKWKVKYLYDACKFLDIHPKTFFDDWDTNNGLVISNVDNSSLNGSNHFSVVNGNTQQILAEKDARIKVLEEMLELQKKVIAKYEATQN